MEERKEKKTESVLWNEEELYIRPKAADRKMKTAQTISQTIYLYGVSGSGKTSFIRNFMGKRRYYYYSAENLTKEELQIPRAGKQIIVVIDDLHLVGMDPIWEGLQKEIALLAAREDVWLILSGRSRMPSWLIPLYYRRLFTVIEEKDLLLSDSELAEYFELWGLQLSESEFHKIAQLISGIGVAARLAAMELASGRVLDEPCIERLRNDFWDYLDHQVYDHWEIELMEFLMQVCIVEEFDLRLAEMISGRHDVERMINLAEQVGNFISLKGIIKEKAVYEIRQIMRQSMRRRLLRTYPKERWERFYYNAGLYYELSEDAPNALRMYELCGDMERIAGLLISYARKNPSGVYCYELRKYYLELPEEKIRESIDLMGVMCMLQSILMNIDESERWYEELKQTEEKLKGSARKAARSWLIYLDIGIPHRGSVALLDIIKNADALVMNHNVTLPEFSITGNTPSQMNGGKDFCEWTRRDKELAKSIGKIVEFTLGKFGKGLVNLGLAESLLEKGGDSYEITSYVNKGILQAQAGGKLEQCFVGFGILSWLHVLSDHAEDAEKLLYSFQDKVEEEGSIRILPNLTAMQIRIGLYQGKTAEALDWLKQAPEEELEFATIERYRYLTKARVYLLIGREDKALFLLQRLLYYAEVMKRTYIGMEAELLLAITMFRIGDTQWDEILQKALAKTESYHFVRIVSREGAAINRLLKESKWKCENQEYRGAVLAETEKMALSYPGYLKPVAVEASFSENALRILKLQAEGLSVAEIADELGLKMENVKYHNKQNFKKLGVNSKTAAVTEARKRKLI